MGGEGCMGVLLVIAALGAMSGCAELPAEMVRAPMGRMDTGGTRCTETLGAETDPCVERGVGRAGRKCGGVWEGGGCLWGLRVLDAGWGGASRLLCCTIACISRSLLGWAAASSSCSCERHDAAM